MIDRIDSWDDVNLVHSLELETYSYLNLCAFAMYYEEQVEEAKTEDLDNEQISGNKKAVKCFELLLDTPYIKNHLDVDTRDRLGATTLHYLARVPGQDSLRLFQRLVEGGANLLITDKEKHSIIHYAIKYKNVRSNWLCYRLGLLNT